jgi:hypothetical protein
MSELPLAVPEPLPLAAIPPAQVAENWPLTVGPLTSVTVHWKLLQELTSGTPTAPADIQVPAKLAGEVDGDGETGEFELLCSKLKQPLVRAATQIMTRAHRYGLLVMGTCDCPVTGTGVRWRLRELTLGLIGSNTPVLQGAGTEGLEHP